MVKPILRYLYFIDHLTIQWNQMRLWMIYKLFFHCKKVQLSFHLKNVKTNLHFQIKKFWSLFKIVYFTPFVLKCIYLKNGLINTILFKLKNITKHIVKIIITKKYRLRSVKGSLTTHRCYLIFEQAVLI